MGLPIVYAIPYSFNGSLFSLEKMGPSAMLFESVSFNGSSFPLENGTTPGYAILYSFNGSLFSLRKMGPSAMV